VRKELRLFAEVMEQKLVANEHKGGWGSKQCFLTELLGRLEDETRELRAFFTKHCDKCGGSSTTEVPDKNDYMSVIQECADVANFAMMIADRVGEEDFNIYPLPEETP
jgi:hypothetical protein